MRAINVLGIQRLSAEDARRIEAIDPRIRYTDACDWFDGEIRDTWNSYASDHYLAPGSNGRGTREERDRLLANAEIIYGGWPYPLDLRARSPNLKWFHQRAAGASNLLLGDLWGSDVTVTTGRGLGNTRAMAEYVLAGILHFTRGFDRAETDCAARCFTKHSYKPVSVLGKTICVIGAGGIGQEVAQLCATAGMRVVGTRRSPAAGAPPAPFAELAGSGDLDRLLGEADFVVVCCQWTPETTRLINAQRLGAMKPGAILLNVARGEIIDEAALLEALKADRLRGVALDVYDGEFERDPPEELWADPRVLITPHVSAGTDRQASASVELFLRNLRAYVDGRPLDNVLDWARGY
jgi:phosphoglycerate dehydrogenase-like enzyme